ncbi:family 78 glycoside hydrolase catalytic domain [Microbacterium sp. 22215]|uniref:family 78 glycoside hydrolase catalytic domain n=1 Tax=Microbacterium sp. 22215 TaxID=3453893 RepID=UPI003F829397
MPEVRSVIDVSGTVERARLAFTSNGVVVPLIDDRPAISGQLEPGYSQPDGPTPAVSWDITAHLAPGTHEVVLRLGSGMAFLPRSHDRYSKFSRTGEPLWVRAAIQVHHRDGRVESVITSGEWETRLGGTVDAHWYGGEEHDPHEGTPWVRAVEVPSPEHSWRWGKPVEVSEVLPARLMERTQGSRIFDAGTNAAGRFRVTAPSARSERVVLTPGEVLTADGTSIDQSTTGTPIWDAVRLDGRHSNWAPSFVYHGGRYLQLRGGPDDATVDLEVMRASNELVQTFSTSHVFLQRLHDAVDRAVQSNMYSVFTDCPHREKLGWLEQLYLCFDAIARGYDAKAHLTGAVQHMLHAQTPAGLVPNIAPEHIVFDSFPHAGDITAFRDDPNWGRAILELPYKLYRHYGDTTAMEMAWPAAIKYLDYLASRADGHLLDYGLGDWVTLDDSTPVGMVATWGYASAADTAAKIARVLDDTASQTRFEHLADDIWAAWRHKYLDETTGVWGSGSQGSWALAHDARVHHGDERAEVYRRLVDAIHGDGDALTVGEISLSPLINALAENGDSELLLAVIERDDVPGYGLQLARGATALTESWGGTQGTAGVLSQNHFMLGAIDSWILGHVAGLRQHPDGVGWSHVVIDPVDIPELSDCSLVFESPHGRYEVKWQRDETGVRQLSYSAPPGAKVDVPGESARRQSVEQSSGRYPIPDTSTRAE